MKNIIAIVGSASKNSSNLRLIKFIVTRAKDIFNIAILDDLKNLPPFSPELSVENPPKEIVIFRKLIQQSDGVIICTPEYIFSIPSALKNILEWSVSTTIFSEKPLGLITAASDGRQGHEELKLIMKTLMANFNTETTLLIQGIKGKINENNIITDKQTLIQLEDFLNAFRQMVY